MIFDRLFKKHITIPKNKQTIEALWRLEKVILDSLDFKTVSQKIVDSLLTELEYLDLGYKIIVLTLIDKKTNTLKRVSISQTPEATKALALSPIPFPHIDIPLDDANNLSVKVIKSKEPSYTNNWHDILTPAFSKKQSKSLQDLVGIESALVYPVILKQEVLGTLIFSLSKPISKVSTTERDLLSGFTDVVGLAVQNASLYSAREETLAELQKTTIELKEKNKNLKLLRKMDAIITTALTVKEVCQKSVDTLSWELGHDFAYICILDQESGCLIPNSFSHSIVVQKIEKITNGDLSIFGANVLDTSNPLVKSYQSGKGNLFARLNEVLDEDRCMEIIHLLEGQYSTAGLLILPLMIKNRVVGVLAIAINTMPDVISANDRELFGEFVKEVGIALDNAMLYEEVKRTNQALIDTNKRLIELDRMKDEFVSIASHELRTPMTAINSYVWMALNKGGELPVKARDYLDKVSISTQRLISLVEDMLNVSRIESGRVKIELVNFNVASLVADVHEELQIKAHERSLELIFERNDDEFVVHGDKNKTREVLTNLIGNALKFTDHGKVTTMIKETEGMIEVSVKDTGRGIAESDMQRLFTKFGRLENELSTIAQTQGTGLGLYICKKYMEAMHGEIGVESTLGEGSRFWFRLPKGDVA